jgi:4-hydroxythreonine-4-phosphate dehydrogenase
MGDPSGIGPAITVKALSRLSGIADFSIIGDAAVLNKIPGFSKLLSSGVKVIDLKNVDIKRFKFAKIDREYGRASIEYLDRALKLLKEKEIDCLITCPISKESINLAGFNYSGHTEYFIKKTKPGPVVMMLLNKYLRFSLVTRHLSLRKVPAALTPEEIYKTAFITYKWLNDVLGIKHPRIILCGLNPHASDNGLIGSEEVRVIRPAAKRLQSKIKGLYGPLPADIAIHKALMGEYDAVVAMYHDQALIPLKITGMDSGVNITLGLSFIRTSPLHGTAFDLAANPSCADPGSLVSAIKLALKCVSIQKKA